MGLENTFEDELFANDVSVVKLAGYALFMTPGFYLPGV